MVFQLNLCDPFRTFLSLFNEPVSVWFHILTSLSFQINRMSRFIWYFVDLWIILLGTDLGDFPWTINTLNLPPIWFILTIWPQLVQSLVILWQGNFRNLLDSFINCCTIWSREAMKRSSSLWGRPDTNSFSSLQEITKYSILLAWTILQYHESIYREMHTIACTSQGIQSTVSLLLRKSYICKLVADFMTSCLVNKCSHAKKCSTTSHQNWSLWCSSALHHKISGLIAAF